jgi:predicted ATPase/DNA-binding SARP family transcriptional activator
MLRLQLFGPPIIQHTSEALSPFKSRKVEALLYFLALTPGQHRRTYLANLLWSEWSEEKALGNLRYALWNLRQVLGEDLVSGDRLSITLQDRTVIWSDVSAFRELFRVADAQANPHAPEVITQLQQAVDLYRGDLLAGLEVGEAPFFQDWLQQQRTALHDIAVRCLIHLGTYYASYHYLPEAIAATRRLLDLEPWREAAHRQMMRLLALAGRRDAALAHYQHCRQILAAELDLEPEPETVALMERIRAGDLELAPEDNPTTVAPEANALAIPLFGRHAEYAWLVERWDIACRGRSRLALIRGEAGVGKTRLAEELSRLVLAQGGLMLRGRCYEFSGPVPYQPIAAALQQQITRYETRSLPLSETWLVELAQLLPEVRERYVDLPPSLPTGQSTDRYRLFEAVSHFLQAITVAQPTLFFLDDLHWADSDTLDMLGYLLRRLTNSRLLIVGAYRPGEVLNDHALVALDRPLLYDGFNEELELARLSKETVQQMTRSITLASDSDRLAGFLYRLSEGNPFILFEALNEMQEHGWLQPTAEGQWSLKATPLDQEELISAEVQARIRRRVARLAPESRSLLSLAAVIGRPFEARLLQAASGASPEHVLSCLDDWLARHLTKEVASPDQQGARASDCHYDFSHDLIRAVVYADLSQARRQIMHTQLGDALEQIYAGQAEKIVEWLAHHYHYGYRPQKALRYLQLAGQQAQTVYALPLALERYRRALSYWERLYNVSDTDLPTDAWRQRWGLLLSQAEVNRMLGQLQTQQPSLEIVLQEVNYWGDDQDRLQVIEQQIARLEQTADLDQRRRLAQEGLRLARLLGAPLAEGNFLQALADCERDMANFEQALSHYEAALINFSHLEQTRLAAFCLISMGNIHLLHNRYAQALTHFCQAKAYAEARGYQDALIWSYNAMAQLYLFLGGLDEAERLSQEALSLCELIGFDSGASTGLVIQGYVNMLGGRLDQAQAQYERAWAINQEMGQTLRMADVQCCLGNLCLLRGEAERAIAHFKQVEALCGSYYSGRAIEARSQRAMAHLALKQMADALHCSAHAVIWLSRHAQNMLAPQRVYLNQYHVLLAQGEMEEAQDALVNAYTIVQAQLRSIAELYATKTDDAPIRERFLTRLPWNREIMEIWESLPLATSVTVLRTLHGYPG